MSKSRGNVINPDDVVHSYGAIARNPHATWASVDCPRIAGADSLRLYEMFMGPLRETKVWSTRSVDGVHRFLGRVWRLYEAHASSGGDAAPSEEQLRVLHSTIKRVTGACYRESHVAMHCSLNTAARAQLTLRRCGSTLPSRR